MIIITHMLIKFFTIIFILIININFVYATNDSARAKALCKGIYDLPSSFTSTDDPYKMLLQVSYILADIEFLADICLSDINHDTKYGKVEDLKNALHSIDVVLKGGVSRQTQSNNTKSNKQHICERMLNQIDKKIKAHTEDKDKSVAISAYLRYSVYCYDTVNKISKNLRLLGNNYMQMKMQDEYTRRILSKLNDIELALTKVKTNTQALVKEIQKLNPAAGPIKNYHQVDQRK